MGGRKEHKVRTKGKGKKQAKAGGGGGTSPYLALDFFSKKGMFRRPEGDFLRSCGKTLLSECVRERTLVSTVEGKKKAVRTKR